MPPDPKSEDELLAKSTRAKPDERAIYEMAELAHQLGFQSAEINISLKLLMHGLLQPAVDTSRSLAILLWLDRKKKIKIT